MNTLDWIRSGRGLPPLGMHKNTIIMEKPNTTKPNKPKGIQVSITDMEIFKEAIKIIIELVKDESVDKDIRMRYFDKLAKVIEIEDYHIEL